MFLSILIPLPIISSIPINGVISGMASEMMLRAAEVSPGFTQERTLETLLPTPLIPGNDLDPNLLSSLDSCDRDYSTCPSGFVSIGAIYGAGNHCGADRSVYFGPCGGRSGRFFKIQKQSQREMGEFLQHFLAMRCL